MKPFSYSSAASARDALAQIEARPGRFIGGGTNLVDLMRQDVENADALVDISRLPGAIEETSDGGLIIGAAVRNSVVAADPRVRTRYPVLSRALLAGASAQIRNMATVGGNILQRTRCSYFYDVPGSRCNKRAPGAGCDAIGGFTRYHAILGASAQCVATHPSDMCVALTALDAIIHIEGPESAREVAMGDFHLLPEDRPDIETVLQPGELITAIEVPAASASPNAVYRKVRDRASYAFALVSVAAVLEVEGGTVSTVRLALGGVAPKPWRARLAEQALIGGPATPQAFEAAASLELAAARPLRDNEFKIELTKRVIGAVLQELAHE